jgi:hypothetical protein
VCRVKLAIMFGILAFLLNYIPNFGSLIAMVTFQPGIVTHTLRAAANQHIMLLHSLGMVCNDTINVVALVAQLLPLPIILVDENLSSNEKVFAAALPVSATQLLTTCAIQVISICLSVR